MKKLFTLILLAAGLSAAAQNVGINTATPKATLEVVGAPGTVGVQDGIIPPKLTRAQLIAKTGYGTDQIGVMVYVTDLSGTTNTATAGVLQIGYYSFDGAKWLKLSGQGTTEYGDIKTGIQTADHNGWIKLDGRAKSTLTTSQQSAATTLGIGANLVNANNMILTQGGTVGTTSAATAIAQAQLPNVKLYVYANSFAPNTGLGATTLSHDQTFTTSNVWNYTLVNTDKNANTGESSSLNGNVTQTSLSTTNLPRLNVTYFIYLGF